MDAISTRSLNFPSSSIFPSYLFRLFVSIGELLYEPFVSKVVLLRQIVRIQLDLQRKCIESTWKKTNIFFSPCDPLYGSLDPGKCKSDRRIYDGDPSLLASLRVWESNDQHFISASLSSRLQRNVVNAFLEKIHPEDSKGRTTNLLDSRQSLQEITRYVIRYNTTCYFFFLRKSSISRCSNEQTFVLTRSKRKRSEH